MPPSLALLVGLALVPAAVAQDLGRFGVDPATLAVSLDGREIVHGVGGLGTVEDRTGTDGSAAWRLPDAGLRVVASVEAGRLSVRVRSDAAARLAWPVLPVAAHEGLALPMAEGVWVDGEDDELWSWLRSQGAQRVTEALALPFVGVCSRGAAVVCAMPEPFYHDIGFGSAGEHCVTITHEWTSNRPGATHEVVLFEAPEGGPVGAARAYREFLDERGGIVTLRERIAARPAVARLGGAIHAYLWGDARFSRHALDRSGWRAFARELAEHGPGGDGAVGQLWRGLDPEAREAVAKLARLEHPERWLCDAVAGGIADVLRSGLDAEVLAAAFDGLLPSPAAWGDGASRVLLDAMREAGIDRALLVTADLDDALARPDVVAHARDLGYLLGPYDSYHSVHDPEAPADSTWATAQLGREAFERGRVIGLDGAPSRGFKKRGFHVSPLAARPLVERRVDERMLRAPFGAWFVDCDGFGQFFDDVHPDHPATRVDDAKARRSRLEWLASEHGLVVGSEGATAVMAPAIDFAHGVLTPVFGWGDPLLNDRESEFFLGRYWPADEPAVFCETVPLHLKYRRPWFEPRDRLPLFQLVLGDSVVATHHWTSGSRKFDGVGGTRTLLEILYAVPPLYHLNRARWAAEREAIVRHHRFWSPLHRAVFAAPMVGFDWLTEDRMVQRTEFDTGTGRVTITVNFDHDEREGVPARTAVVGGAVELEHRTFTVAD